MRQHGTVCDTTCTTLRKAASLLLQLSRPDTSHFLGLKCSVPQEKHPHQSQRDTHESRSCLCLSLCGASDTNEASCSSACQRFILVISRVVTQNVPRGNERERSNLISLQARHKKNRVSPSPASQSTFPAAVSVLPLLLISRVGVQYWGALGSISGTPPLPTASLPASNSVLSLHCLCLH